MANDTYNGWTNYETWNVKLWMDNDEGSYRHWKDQAQEAWDDSEAGSVLTREEEAAGVLSETLKSHFESEKDDMLEATNLSSSMWADLLGATISEVNWYEIAKSLIEDVDKEEPEEENEEADEDEE